MELSKWQIENGELRAPSSRCPAHQEAMLQDPQESRLENTTMKKSLEECWMRFLLAVGTAMFCTGRRLQHDERGQGTTEYAILVGVIVVIAIIAVIAFRENLQQLWESITSNINSL